MNIFIYIWVVIGLLNEKRGVKTHLLSSNMLFLENVPKQMLEYVMGNIKDT